MKTNLSLFGSSSLRGGGRVLDPICTMSLYLPFFGFDGAPKHERTDLFNRGCRTVDTVTNPKTVFIQPS